MVNKALIGVFDSGVGGLTVLKELVQVLPNHSYIYFADTKHCPYGPKGTQEIIRLSETIVQYLINQGCAAIVVACNTATAAAIDYLRDKFSVPFVGMEPAVKPAALATKTKSIGVLATKGTFNGRLYKQTTAKYAANIDVHYQIGNGLVEMVEQGKAQSDEAKNLLESYITPMLEQKIDHLVLGCTHYPFFIPMLKEILPSHVVIENPAPAVAKQTARIILKCNATSLKTEPFVKFISSGTTTTLELLVDEIEKNTEIVFKNKLFQLYLL